MQTTENRYFTPKIPPGGYPSLHDRQNIPRPNRIPHNHRHPNYASALRRLQLILHLHRLNHHDSLAFHHLLTSIHQHAHYTSRHGSLHRPRPLRPGPTTRNPSTTHFTAPSAASPPAGKASSTLRLFPPISSHTVTVATPPAAQPK